MEAQTPRNGILAGSLGNESSESVKSNDPLHRRYTVMMQICAATNTKEDISRAMSIAFEVTERMIRGNMKLNSKTFQLMYFCVQNFLDHNPEEERQKLLQRVFDLASKQGIARADFTGWHKESLKRKNHLGAKSFL
jgi:adenylate cyclase